VRHTTGPFSARLAAAALLLFAASSCQRASSTARALTSIAAVQSLTLAQAAEGAPVELEGYIPLHRGKEVFLCDAQACIALDTTESALQLSQDPLARVRGRTGVVDQRRVVTGVDVKVMGQKDATLEDQPTMRFDEVLDGRRDAAFVSAKGRVRGVHEGVQDRLEFTLATAAGQLLSTSVYGMAHGGCGYPPLNDAEIRVVGMAVADHDANGRVTGARLQVSRCGFVRIIADGPQDVFAGAPVTTADARGAVGHRVLVRGALRVTDGAEKRYAVEDTAGTLAFVPAGDVSATNGQDVLVTGYPEMRDGAIALSDTLVQTLPRPAAAAPAANLPTLTTVAQVRRLSADEARKGYPVRVRAVVTYTESRRAQFFVQDQTQGIYVAAWRHLIELPAGQEIEVVGRSEPGLFAPIVDSPRVTVLGPAPLPKAIRVSFDDLLTGSLDSQWVEVEGLVRGVHRVGTSLRIDVVSIGLSGRLPVTVPNFDGPVPQNLIDTRVRIRGVCAFDFNNRNQPVAVKLLSPALSQVEVLENSASDPFSIEATSLKEVMHFDVDRGLQRRLRIHGVVTLHAPGRFAYVQEGEIGMMVSTDQEIELHTGDVIDAVGFPSMGRVAPQLDDAIVRVVGKGEVPKPQRSTPEQVYDGNGDATLVTMRGRVVNSVASAGEQILTIRDRSFLISAHLQRSGAIPSTWPAVDALVDVTGLCAVQEILDGHPQSYRLLLRGDDDIALVEAAPWWTRGRVISALLLVTGILFLSWLWVAALQRTIRQQTAVIQAKLAREAALEERYRQLFESANDIVFTLDAEGRLTSLNHAGRDLFGLAAEEVAGRRLPDLVVPDDADQARQLLRHESSSEGAAVGELDAHGRDGRTHTLELSVQPTIEGGRVMGFEGIARDITERKQTEAQLIAFAAQLEERNAELQSFADVASHDLQEPLRKVRAFAEKLTARWESLSRTETTDTLQRMQNAAERMQALITQLLSYARLGKIEPQRATVDMGVIAREVLEDLEARIEQTGGRVELGALPVVDADPVQVRQLVQNLVGNALKFARPGERPVVRVYATPAPRDGWYEIAVQDNGIGFASAEAERVFRPFYRLHTRQQYEGTGLGLAICQKIVERHGGTIRAVSAPGEGTTFLFTMAVAARDSEAVGASA
jgi:PAS domain S-box-containing protein